MGEKKNTVLIVDAEPETRKMLEIILAEDKFRIEECHMAKQAISLSLTIKPDIILLATNLPDMDSFDVIKVLREWSHRPIIILSLSSADRDVVKALNLGADDYVLKPFNLSVLEARINACLRKGAIHEAGEPVIVNGMLHMDLVRHEVFMDNTLIPFTPKEYNLLRYLMIHRGKMLTHKQILKEVWGPAHSDDAQYLRVFIGQLRNKIENNPAVPKVITTEPGIGYRMEIIEEIHPAK